MSGKEHLIGNLNAKKGMRLLKSEGSLKEFSRRQKSLKVGKNLDEMFDWEKYCTKSKQHSQNLQSKQPDIMKRINEIHWSKKERQRQWNEQSNAEQWDYDDEMVNGFGQEMMHIKFWTTLLILLQQKKS